MDFYKLLGVEPTASESEVRKAYRKKALTCHPDKNQDNPRAAQLFQNLSKALEVLTDSEARAAHDRDIAARKQAKERVRQLDAKRKRFKEKLDESEETYKRSFKEKSDEERTKAEVKKLQEWFQQEQQRLLEEEISTRKLSMEKLSSNASTNVGNFIIKIKWKVQDGDETNGGYNYENLHKIFYKYGDIAALVISSTKKGSAMIEFGDKNAAETALLLEIGLAENPLTLRGLWKQRSSSANIGEELKFPTVPLHSTSSTPCAFLSFPSAPDIFQRKRMSDAERSVLANLRRAEERKRLIEELKTQEEI